MPLEGKTELAILKKFGGFVRIWGLGWGSAQIVLVG